MVKTHYKTGALFSASLRGTGAILNMTEEEQYDLFKAGLYIATAFAMSDDLLDLTMSPIAKGEKTDFNKSTLNDLEELNITAPYLMTYFDTKNVKGNIEARKFWKNLMKEDKNEEDYKYVVEEYLSGDANLRCQSLINFHMNEGLNLLQGFCEVGSQEFEGLRAFGEFIIKRRE